MPIFPSARWLLRHQPRDQTIATGRLRHARRLHRAITVATNNARSHTLRSPRSSNHRSTGTATGVSILACTLPSALECSKRQLLVRHTTRSGARHRRSAAAMEPWNVENSSSPASGSQLYTSHFPVQMNEELLRSLFERFGPLREVACKFASTSATWGPSHAFVTYEKPEDAQAAIAAMDGLKGNEMLRSILEKRDQKFSWRDEVLEVKPRTFVGSRSRSDGAGSRRGPPASGSRNGGSSRPEPSRYRSADNGFDPSRSPVRRRSPPGGFRSPPREREPRSPPPRDREYRSPPLEDRGAYSSPRERDARERDRFHRELPSREPPSRHDDRAHDSYSRSPPPSNDRDRRGYSPPARAMRRSRSRSPTQMRRPPSGDYQRSSRD